MRVSKIVLLLSMMILAFSFTAEAQQGKINRADKAFKKYKFEKAAKLYEKALDKDPTITYAKQQAAQCYYILEDWANAEVWYGELANNDKMAPIYKFKYAQVLRNQEKYEQAKPYYIEYSLLKPSDTRGKTIAAGIDYVDQLRNPNPIYDIEVLTINGGHSDFGAAVDPEGNLLFSSNRMPNYTVKRTDNASGQAFYQIYKSPTKEDGTHEEVDMLGHNPPSGKLHDGTIAFDPTNNYMYFSRNNYKGSKVSKDDDGNINLKIFSLAPDDEGSYKGAELIAFPYNSDYYSVSHPTISADGQYMFFASDMNETMTDKVDHTDIFMCKRQGEGWGTPKRLGANINTMGDEMFPFIAEDNTLYFSSDSRIGLGGLDIYSVSMMDDGSFKFLQNLGAPLNTNHDDFGYVEVAGEQRGYFVSNRPGYGSDDIYSFVKNCQMLTGVVYDEKTGDPIPGATVVIKNNKQNRTIMTVTADGQGAFESCVPDNAEYRLIASKDGYLPNDQTVIQITGKPEFVRIPLIKGLKLDITVIDEQTRQPIYMANVEGTNLERKETDENGKVFYYINPGKMFEITGEKFPKDPNDPAYPPVTINVSSVGAPPVGIIYDTIELVQRDFFILPSINYDLDKYNIRPDAAVKLDKVVALMKEYPSLEIELGSHTDCRANTEYNMWLSAKRAESAVNYIISKGISGNRMIAAGYGETRLINECDCKTGSYPEYGCPDEVHEENRRTEIKILSY